MINESPSACRSDPGAWFIVNSNVLVKLVDEDIGVVMNAVEFVFRPPLTRLRSLVVAVALPFLCNVVKSMLPALAAVAPRTPTDNAALAKHDLKQIFITALH